MREDVFLLHRPPIAPREGVRGYALRVAELNARHDLIVPHVSKAKLTTAFVNSLAGIVQQPARLLKKRACFVLGPRPQGNINTNTVPHHATHGARRRFCPSCLFENVLSPAIWELKRLPGCSRHNRILAKNCPSCSCEFTWTNTGLLTCNCGQDLRVIETRELTPAERILSMIFLELSGDYCSAFGTTLEFGPFRGQPTRSVGAFHLLLELIEAICFGPTLFKNRQPIASNHRDNRAELVVEVLDDRAYTRRILRGIYPIEQARRSTTLAGKPAWNHSRTMLLTYDNLFLDLNNLPASSLSERELSEIVRLKAEALASPRVKREKSAYEEPNSHVQTRLRREQNDAQRRSRWDS